MDVIDISRLNEVYDRKDYTAFMKHCLLLNNIEDSRVLYRIGNCYYKGNGVAVNIPAAIEWLSKAAEKGSTEAMLRLAIIYHDEKEVQDYNKTVEWYEKGSERGNVSCMYNLGCVYARNEVLRDISKAIYWYTLAANKGHTNAMYNLGYAYAVNEKIKDISKAIHWYTLAANNGHSKAMLNLAIIYHDEKEVQDYNKTVEWYEKGSEQGNVSCMYNLGWVYKGNEQLKDISKAIHWFKCSANCGHENGKFWFAKLVIENDIAEEERNAYQALLECSVKGMDKALNLLTEKSKNGSSVAQFYLGRYYMEMTDVQEHEQIAFEWYRKSAVQGYIPAQNIILINQSENTSQTIKEIKIDTSTIVDTTAENSRKLDEIANNLMSMNEKIANIRATSFTGNADTEENEIGSALEKSAAVINNTVHDSPADKLNKHTEHLVYLFGEQTWERLLPDTQKSLISSAYLLKECEGMPPDFDYSGICITAVVALEKELKRLFSDNYIKYLKEVSEDEDKDKDKDKNKDKDKDNQLPYLFRDKNYFFSLGKMATLFGYDVENNVVKYNYYARRMEEYLKTITKYPYSYDPLYAFIEKDNPNCFVRRCLTINKTYRCKAAHCGNVSYDDAMDCCYEIYGEASAHIDAKRQSAEIISLLRELFSKLK